MLLPNISLFTERGGVKNKKCCKMANFIKQRLIYLKVLKHFLISNPAGSSPLPPKKLKAET
jgi:hypothetical protein